MSLSANANVDRLVDTQLREYELGAAQHVYRGALVGVDPAGYLKPFEPGDLFVGYAYKEGDNSSGSAGAVKILVYVDTDFIFTLSGVALTDIGKACYATADNALALTGHPDAYVGRIIGKYATSKAVIRLKQPGEAPPDDGSCILIDVDFASTQFVNQDESVATLRVAGTGLKTAAVGAGLSAGSSGFLMDEATGEARLLLDNDNEAENLTVETPQVFNITKAATFDLWGNLYTAGGAATDDLDFGLMGLTGGITATERADMNAATAGLLSCLFHVDTNGLDLYASSDDNSSPISATDTTVNLVLQTQNHFKIICRTDGSCEVWVDGVRKISSTALSVGAAGLLAGILNLEKSTGTGVPEVRIRRYRVAGALA